MTVTLSKNFTINIPSTTLNAGESLYLVIKTPTKQKEIELIPQTNIGVAYILNARIDAVMYYIETSAFFDNMVRRP